MQMRHGLTRVGTVVNHQSVAGGFQAKLVGHFRRFEQEMTENFFILELGIGDARQSAFWE